MPDSRKSRTSTLYLRLSPELKREVEAFASAQEGGLLTDGAIQLIRDGLHWHKQARERIETKQRLEAAHRELTEVDQQIDHFERERLMAMARVRTAQVKQEAAEERVGEYQRQLDAFRYWFEQTIAQCTDCEGNAGLRHVAAGQCPTTGLPSRGYKFLPPYQTENPAELIRALASVVGAASVILATRAPSADKNPGAAPIGGDADPVDQGGANDNRRIEERPDVQQKLREILQEAKVSPDDDAPVLRRPRHIDWPDMSPDEDPPVLRRPRRIDW